MVAVFVPNSGIRAGTVVVFDDHGQLVYAGPRERAPRLNKMCVAVHPDELSDCERELK